MTILAAANDYLARGWRIVPLKDKTPSDPKTGKPIKKWQKSDFKDASAFNGHTTGVGVISEKIGDVDFDSAAAKYIGPRVMTKTAEFGRGGSITHLVYDCVELYFEDIRLPGDDNHIELRADAGHQTMFPGSMHPCGDKVEWMNDLAPTVIALSDLQREVNLVAVLCIFAHFYEPGQRDNLLVILANVLHAEMALPVEDVQHVCDVLMEFKDDTDKSRQHKASKTIRAQREKKLGLPRLAKIIGKEWSEKVRELLKVKAPVVWPEPLDVFTGIDTPPVPENAVPEIALKWAKDIAHRANAPVECALFPLMVQTMNAAGSSVRIRLRPEWSEPAIFFSYVAVKSGSGKSPAMGEAFRPLKKLNKDADQERLAMLELRGSITKANDALPRGLEKKPLPEVPPIIRHMLRDVTIETVAERYNDNPRGLCNIHDELSMFANSGKRYGNSAKGSSIDEQIWCSMYDGDEIIKDRSTGKSIYTSKSCISIFGGIQPGRLTDLVHRDNESLGLVARFNLIALPKLPPVEIVRRAADAEARTLFEDRLEWIRNSIEYDKDATLFFDAQENEAFRIEDERLRRYAREVGEPFCAHMSKFPGLLARVSLCFHLMTFDTDDVVENDLMQKTFDAVRDVPEQTVQMAIRFLNYLHEHAVAIYKLTGSTRAETVAQDIAAVIMKTDNEPSILLRDLKRTGRSNLKHEDEIIEGLRHLDSFDWGHWEPNAKTPAGRLSPRFVINPKVFAVQWGALSCQENDLSCQYGTDKKETARNQGLKYR